MRHSNPSITGLAFVAVVNLTLAGPGGLVSYPGIQVGRNLLTNGGVETDNGTGKPAAWYLYGYERDITIAHTGSASFRIVNPASFPYSTEAHQDVSLTKGVYRISGWVKLRDLGTAVAGSVRLCLSAPPGDYQGTFGNGCTAEISGTRDWTYIERTGIAISHDARARFSISTYGAPNGAAWVDDVQLQQDLRPYEVFLLYPNYRGFMFDDQSQTARFDINVNWPTAANLTGWFVRGNVTDESTGTVLRTDSFPASHSLTTSVDFSSLPNNRNFLVTFRLLNSAGTVIPYTYPAYRIIKVPGKMRASMKVSFDEQNRFLLRGKPSFLLGVYDSGLGYVADEAAWENMFTKERRLFELPINFYLNYWYGAAPNDAMLPMMNVLKRHGIYNLTNANCFSDKTIEQQGRFWFTGSSDATIHSRAAHLGFGGFYVADECQAAMVSSVMTDYLRMKNLDQDGIVFGTLLPGTELPLWRDALDVLSSDPYPLYGPEPVRGYTLSRVSDGIAGVRQALHAARPFVATIQFFQSTNNSRWPTTSELRSMSYAAIVEGANGLFYWSLGTSALAWVCSDWCDSKADYFHRLKTVMTEIKRMELVLTAIDRPDLLAENSNASAIHTRVKYDGARVYLIAFNTSATHQSATFSWASSVNSAARTSEISTLPVADSRFSGSFEPFEARIYEIAISIPDGRPNNRPRLRATP